MTYCVGMRLNQGLVFMSDTRTNAGVDNVSVNQKLFRWEVPQERVVTVMTAGNLATTQTVINLVEEQAQSGDGSQSILNAPSMFRVARLIGKILRETIQEIGSEGSEESSAFRASIVVGGQIRGESPRMFMIYPEGNFIESGPDTPYFQLGETKYGKPILARAYRPDLTFEHAIKLLIVSFDSTIKSNLLVGLPLDLSVYEAETLVPGPTRRLAESDAYYRTISKGWSQAIQLAFDSLPDFSFGEG